MIEVSQRSYFWTQRVASTWCIAIKPINNFKIFAFAFHNHPAWTMLFYGITVVKMKFFARLNEAKNNSLKLINNGFNFILHCFFLVFLLIFEKGHALLLSALFFNGRKTKFCGHIVGYMLGNKIPGVATPQMIPSSILRRMVTIWLIAINSKHNGQGAVLSQSIQISIVFSEAKIKWVKLVWSCGDKMLILITNWKC